jgi:glycosyltransferase involved in cell wall biosynthesis
MITQKVDSTDPLLAFTIDWIRALAARVDRIEVLCLEQHDAILPENVRVWSMGKERSVGRIQELRNFYRVLNSVIRETDVVFSHMVARYALLALPLARLYGKQIGLWYTHPRASWELRLTAPLLNWIATADLSSFPLHGRNIHALGHGIDTARFDTPVITKADPPLIASVGRLSPIKGHAVLIRAAKCLKTDYPDVQTQVVIAGGEVPNAPGHRDKLLSLRSDLGLGENDVQLAGALSPEAVVTLYERASVAVNLMPPGSFDKAALEAMMSSLPLIAVNPAFAPVWGEYTDQLKTVSDPRDLAARLAGVLRMTATERTAIGSSLRDRAIAGHSLTGLMDQLVALMQR